MSLRLSTAVVAVIAMCGTSALAQPSGGPKVQTAYSEWRNLPQAEVNCVDKALQAQHSNLWTWIQRGIGPNDPAVAKMRAGCGARVATPNTQGMTALAQSEAAKKATSEKAAAEKAATEKAAAEKAAAKVAAEKAAFEKAAAEKLAAEKAAAEKATAEKAAAEKATAEKAAAEKAAAEKIAAEKAAAEKAAAEKVAADKAAADAAAAAEMQAAEKAEAERVAALKAAEEKAAAEKAAEIAAAEKAAADKIAADKAAMDSALAEAERVKLEAIQAKTDAEAQKQDAVNVAFARAATESRISFVYGLILGLVFASLAAAVFLLMQRKKNGANTQTEAALEASRERQSEFDRLVTAMLAEHERRFSKKPGAAPAPSRDQQPDWSALH